MNLKKLAFFLTILLISVPAFTQNFSGSWIGVFHTDMLSVRRSFNFSMQLQQKGSAVRGIYMTTSGDSLTIKKSDCTCSISGQSGKKDKTFLNLYKDGVIQSKNTPYEICNFLNYLEVEYLQKSGQTFLTGKWFGNYPSQIRSDGASGSFTLQKVSDSITEDINSYFPGLHRIIKKNNHVSTKFDSDQQKPTSNNTALTNSGIKRKTPFEKRDNIIFKNITTDAVIIDVDLYDNGIIDNDTISVYLNKKIILKDYRLTDVSKKLQLQIDADSENEILIVAENLGSIPPNTGLIIINAGAQRHEIHLSSSFQSNAKILVRNKAR